MADSLTHSVLTRIMLPLGLILGLALAAAVVIARQSDSPVIITAENVATPLEAISIFDPGRPSDPLTLTLPGSTAAAWTLAYNRRYVLFGRDRANARTISVFRDLYTGRELALTPYTTLEPSPDMSLAALVTPLDATEPSDSASLTIFDVASWGTRPLMDGRNLRLGAWSSDNRLAIVRDGTLYVTASGGHSPLPVATAPITEETEFLFSPDGTHLIVRTSGDTGIALTMIDTHTTASRIIAASRSEYRQRLVTFRWSPDSGHVLVLYQNDTQVIADVIDIQTGATRSLTTQVPGGLILEAPRMSSLFNPNAEMEGTAAGSYMATTLMENYAGFNVGPLRVLLVDLPADSGAGQVIVFGDTDVLASGWSSDGRYLMLNHVATPTGPDALYGYRIYTYTGSTLTPVMPLPDGAQNATWLPDQHHIVMFGFKMRAGNEYTVRLFNLETGSDTVLTDRARRILYVGA